MDLLNIKPERFQALMQTLSSEEQEVIKQILTEYATEGKSQTYENVWMQDYDEIPVDIDTFIEDDEYLGRVTNHGKQIYPFWRERLREIFANGDTDFTEIVFSGAIGIGKTQIAVYALDYLLYRLLCLKNPQRYFGFADTDEIAIFCFNATVALAMGVGYSRIHATCLESPWFMMHGTRGGSDSNPYFIPDKHITIKAGSKASHGLGQQVFAAFLDEVNFAPGQNASVEKSKIMQTYTSVAARIKSRFIKNGKLLGKMFMVSSKHAESDFLEVYIAQRKKQSDAAGMYLVDEPLWVVKPSSTYSGKKFKVAYGAKQLTPQIVQENDDEDALKQMGFSILEVPVEFRNDFEFNIVTALQDLAGVALPGTLSYFNYKIFSKCYCDTPSPWSAEVLQIGVDDHMEYEEFFDFDAVPAELRRLPIAIHVDTALKNDLLGMSAVAYLRNIVQDSDDGLVEKRVYAHVFSVGIQAPPGSEISLLKTRRFLYKLRSFGFNIVVISTDTFQSAEFHQILRDKGFETAIRSLDRTPEGYQILREAMLEQRITLIRHSRLENELIYLQRDTTTGKLDHPPNGCFTGDTEVLLVDGRSLSINELILEQEYKTNWVYTVNEVTGNIEPKPIKKVFQTKLVSDLVRVTLDDGSVITCTPEHRFMLRDGTYAEIQNLSPGESLMPIYTREVDGYRMYFDTKDDCWRYEYHEFCTDEDFADSVVHHRNFKKHDNTPTNLVRLTKSQHTTLHNIRTKNYELVSAGVAAWHKASKGTEAYRLRSSKLREAAYAHYLAADPDYIPNCVLNEQHRQEVESAFNVKYSDLSASEKNSYGNRLARLKDPTIQSRTSATLSQRHAEGKFENAKKALSNRVWYNNGVEECYIKADDTPPEGYVRGRVKGKKLPRKNHKISSIEYLHQPCRVYDLEIEDNHNFALAAGVFVHNSKDISDSLAGAVWDLSLLPYQPALTNFRLELGGRKEADIPALDKLLGGLRPIEKLNFERMR